jgi:site-specific recombinase XerD
MAWGGAKMTAINLASPLATYVQDLITLRQACGRDYRSQGQMLGYFDRFLIQQKIKSTRITRHIIERYQKSLSHLTPRVQANRMCVVRQLCEYLARHDPKMFIPEPMKTMSSSEVRKPYIYSSSELNRLMEAALALPPIGSLRPHTYYTLLGLLYSTGIRIGEACALNLESFDPSRQCLYIAQGKFHKARWVALSHSACQALQHYLDQRLAKEPNTRDDPLFLNERRRRLCHSTIYSTFRPLLDQCNIAHSKQSGPRIHDLRHSFAVHRLLAWYQDGQNINARLPMLATYMGHVDMQSTQVYLRPTAELLGYVSDRFHDYYLRTIDPKGGQS